MRLRRIDRPAVLAELCALAALLSLAPLAPTDAHATPGATPPPDFSEVALQGFGDRANSEAESMQWWNGHLYVGTDRNVLCFKAAAAHLRNPHLPYPPPDPDLLCPPTIARLIPTLGAQVWRLDGLAPPITQTNWTLAYADPATIPVTIEHHQVLAPRSIGFPAMSVYIDLTGTPSLYLSGASLRPLLGRQVPPPGLLHSSDGQSYGYVPSDSGTVMGDVTGCCFGAQASANGTFYLTVDASSNGGAVYTSTNPAAGDNAFAQYTPSYPTTMTVQALAMFDGALYLGTTSPHGYQVWKARPGCRTSPCPWSDFRPLIPFGAGLGRQGSLGVASMMVFTDTSGTPALYVGTDGSAMNRSAELIRIHADDSWDLLVGRPRVINGVLRSPLSQLPGGFGWPYNLQMRAQAAADGWLYVGTFDASTAQQYQPGGYLLRNKMGFDLYATHDGVTFTKVTDNGFGDPFSVAARSLAGTPLGLFVGSSNPYYGLRTWLGQLAPGRLAFAAYDLFEQYTETGRGIALTWSAPPTATQFTVYRAILTEQRVAQKKVWVSSQDVPLITTTNHYYVDHTLPLPTQQFTYFVVAQDGQGDLAEPSNAVDTAVLGGQAVAGSPGEAATDQDPPSPARPGHVTLVMPRQ